MNIIYLLSFIDNKQSKYINYLTIHNDPTDLNLGRQGLMRKGAYLL
jgi:hypothetical protein